MNTAWLWLVWAASFMRCTSPLGILSWGSRWGGSVGGEPERPVEFKWWKAACFRQTVNSLKCLLRLSLTGVDLMNCSYNYQTAGHRHYSAVVSPHVRMYVCVCVSSPILLQYSGGGADRQVTPPVCPPRFLCSVAVGTCHTFTVVSRLRGERQTEWDRGGAGR